MKKRTFFYGLLGLFIFVSLACQAAALPLSSAGKNTQTSSAKVLFQDDFSNPSSGWSTYKDADGENGYADGAYRIFINKADTYAWSIPGKTLSDVVIDVDAKKVAGPDENEFGAICRYKDDNNFYFLTVSSDGYYGVSKVLAGNIELIGMDQLQFKDGVIHPGETSNHIRIECAGDELTISANGQLLADVKDSSFATGDVGLIAMTNETTGLDMNFDNFIVTQP